QREMDRPGSRINDEKWVIPFLFFVNKKCMPWTNKNYLVSNKVAGSFDNVAKGNNTVLFIYSTIDFKLKNYIGIGTGNSAFINQSMDIGKDSIIYTGNYNLSINAVEKITISKLSKDLKNIWELVFSVENKNHNIVGIKALSNGGFVIYGFRKIRGETTGHPFIIKFDENGGLSNTSNFETIRSIKSYPNPSTGILNLNFQGISGITDLRIFDLNGRNVFVQNGITTDEIRLDLSSLTPGNYIYKVYNANKELGSGQWVKVE
ncbi:MAG: T9SS type A sorting domain-containing protein, partial [Saprospiraceae bacterium]